MWSDEYEALKIVISRLKTRVRELEERIEELERRQNAMEEYLGVEWYNVPLHEQYIEKESNDI